MEKIIALMSEGNTGKSITINIARQKLCNFEDAERIITEVEC